MTQRSPVPDWFGGGDRQPEGTPATRAQSRGGAVGCIAFLLSVAIAVAAVGYALDANKRAARADRDRQQAEERLADVKQEHSQAVQNLERQLAEATKPAPDTPTPVAEPGDAGAADSRDLKQPIAELRPKLRACYNNALAYAPEAEGSIQVTLIVAPTGDVESVTLETSGNLPAPVPRCVESVAKTAKFGPGDSARVKFPLVFRAE